MTVAKDVAFRSAFHESLRLSTTGDPADEWMEGRVTLRTADLIAVARVSLRVADWASFVSELSAFVKGSEETAVSHFLEPSLELTIAHGRSAVELRGVLSPSFLARISFTLELSGESLASAAAQANALAEAYQDAGSPWV